MLFMLMLARWGALLTRPLSLVSISQLWAFQIQLPSKFHAGLDNGETIRRRPRYFGNFHSSPTSRCEVVGLFEILGHFLVDPRFAR